MNYPKEVYLHKMVGYVRGEETTVPAGLYEVIEYAEIEPSAYINSPYFLVGPVPDENGDYPDDWEVE